MSIVVTCSCTRTYRLPDRYAGKRCRCRDCGKRIAVPAHEVASKPDASDARPSRPRKTRAKDDPSKTTRRLSSQDNEILGERRRLRSSQRTRPISESMHQLAPMNLSGDLPIAPPRPKKKPAESKAPKKRAPSAKAETITEAPARKSAKKARKEKKKHKKARRDAERGGKAERRAAKRRKSNGRSDDRADDEETPRRGRARQGYSLQAVLAIAGVLCLGIGLVIGGLWTASKGNGGAAAAVDASVEQRLAHIQGLERNRSWTEAKAELDRLAAELRASGDAAGLARVQGMTRGVEGMVQIASIEDDEVKLATLVQYSADRDPMLRFGVAMELRSIAEIDDAQRALATLARDADRRVAEAARQGLVEAGGPHSIPFLGETIEQCAASGHKLGDVALERALELQEPEVVPVLVTALRVRAGASANVLKAILGRLADLGDASTKDAVTPFLTHADEGVRAAAQACVDAFGA